MKELTLCYLLRNKRICLGYKKRGFGEGFWNGFGGKINTHESVHEAAVRELGEECGVEVAPHDLKKMAVMEFFFEDGTHLKVHTFFVHAWKGDPVETEEMKPAWFTFTRIPYEVMWEDDQHWLPRALRGERLTGKVWFDHTDRSIKDMVWEPVEQLL